MRFLFLILSLILISRIAFADCEALYVKAVPQEWPQPESVTKKEVIALRLPIDPIQTSPNYEELRPDVTLGPVAQAFVDHFSWQSLVLRSPESRLDTIKFSHGWDPNLKVKVVSENRVTFHNETSGRPGSQSLEIHFKVSGRKLRELMRLAEELNLERNLMTLDEFKRLSERYRDLYYQAHIKTPGAQDNLDQFIISTKIKTRAFTLEASKISDCCHVKGAKNELLHYDDLPIGTSLVNGGESTTVFEPDESAEYTVTLVAQASLVPLVNRGRIERYMQNNRDTNRYLLMRFFVERVLPLLR